MTGIELALSQLTKSIAKSSLNNIVLKNKAKSKSKTKTTLTTLNVLSQDILDEVLEEAETDMFLFRIRQKQERLNRERLNSQLLQKQNNYHHSHATLTVANKKSKKKNKKGKKK